MGENEPKYASEDMATPEKDLSIIIVSYNVRELLKDCLISIFDTVNEAAVRYEIIVVDNNSKDQTAEMVAARFPRVKLIANSHNHGFAAANNQAIRHARGRYLLLLNPDTIIKPFAIEQVLNFINTTPDAGIVGCKLLNSDGSVQPSCAAFPTLLSVFSEYFFWYKIFPKSPLWGKPYMTHLDLNKIQEVESIKGAFLMIRRDIIERIGLLDERFFIYSEEVDLCYRVKKAGWKIYYFPEAQIIHLGGQSTKQQNLKMFIELHKTKCQLIDKHYSRAHAWLMKTIMALGTFLRALFWGTLALMNKIKGDTESLYLENFKAFWGAALWFARPKKLF